MLNSLFCTLMWIAWRWASSQTDNPTKLRLEGMMTAPEMLRIRQMCYYNALKLIVNYLDRVPCLFNDSFQNYDYLISFLQKIFSTHVVKWTLGIYFVKQGCWPYEKEFILLSFWIRSNLWMSFCFVISVILKIDLHSVQFESTAWSLLLQWPSCWWGWPAHGPQPR